MRTYVGLLAEKEANHLACLNRFTALYNTVERNLYRDWIIKLHGETGNGFNALKVDYLKKFGINGRHFNSVRMNLKGKSDSVLELSKERILDLEEKIKDCIKAKEKLKFKIETLEKSIIDLDSLLLHEDIGSSLYAQYNKNLIENKVLVQKLKTKIVYKNNRLDRLQSQLKATELMVKDKNPKICFGGKKLFQAQYNLESNGLESHADWKQEIDFKKNSQCCFIGSSDETSGNLNAQLEFIEKRQVKRNNEWVWVGVFSLQLNLGYLDCVENKNLNNSNKENTNNKRKPTIIKTEVMLWTGVDRIIQILEANKKIITSARKNYLLKKKENNKEDNNVNLNQEMNKKLTKEIDLNQGLSANPITIRLNKVKIKKENKGRSYNNGLIAGDYQWQVAISVEEEVKNIVTHNKVAGCIGIDLNKNHVSMVEINESGNLVEVKDLVINKKLENKDYLQSIKKNSILKSTTNDLSLVVKEIIAYAVEKKKPIVIEDLDFQQKKKQLVSVKELMGNGVHGKELELNKNYNLMLSSFAYNQFKSLLSARCVDARVELIIINPAYSSIMGKVKYLHKKKNLTIHQTAAFVLARRGFYSRVEKKFTQYYVEKLPKKLELEKIKDLKIKAEKIAKKKEKLDKRREKEIKEDMENQKSMVAENNNHRKTEGNSTGLAKKPVGVNPWEDWKWLVAYGKKSKGCVKNTKIKQLKPVETQDSKKLPSTSTEEKLNKFIGNE